MKEKDNAENMEHHIQMVFQNLYREILEAPIVVEVTMEEQVLNIGKVIKGLCTIIEDL